MNAQTEIQPSEPYAADPSAFDHAEYHGFSPPPGVARYDGWTPEKQRSFLEALSEGLTVVKACAIVGLSKQSAYALRGSPRGVGFAIGWEAAVLKARGALADEMMERAFNGNRESSTSDSGAVTTRHRVDNRLGMAMLARLDRMAEATKTSGIAAAARLVANDFPQYLDLIGRDAGPARAGMFLGARIEPAGEDALAPIRTLARADRWLRTHTDIAEPLDIADLDPAERAGWTAEQWARAEAAGLVNLAPEKGVSSQPSQPLDSDEDGPVWYCTLRDKWVTRFPPPADFDGDEEGYYGDDDYSRTLTDAEQAVLDADDRAEVAEREIAESLERDRYFGFLAEPDQPEPEAPPALEAPADDATADEPPALSDTPRRRSRAAVHTEADPCVEPPSAPSGARTGASPMSIFGSIKDAIFGKAAAAPKSAPAAPPAPAGTPAPQAAPTPAATPAAPEPVDVEMALMVFETERGTADLNWRTSIVDLMKLLGLDSSLDNRKQLATELGYTGAKDGSAEMNLWLHKAVMQELAKNGGNVPASLKG